MKKIEFSNRDQYGYNEARAEQENIFFLWVDDYLVKSELIDHWNDEGAFVRIRPTGAFAPMLIDVYKTNVEWVSSERNPNGALRFSNKEDREIWTLCELVIGYENGKQKSWFITGNHENELYCIKSQKQIEKEREEIRKAGTDALNEDQSN